MLFIYTDKLVGQRFVKMVSNNLWWKVTSGLAIYHLLNNYIYLLREPAMSAT